MPGHLAFPGGTLDATDHPDSAGALARCVAREVAEEIGLDIPAASWFGAGARITPPMFPVRFDARFFVAAAPEGTILPASPPSPREIESMAFERPAAITERWRRGEVRVPPPVLPVLRLLASTSTKDVTELAALVREVNDREQNRTRMEFVPDIWALPLETRTLPPASHTNVWIAGGTHFVIVDPGSDQPDEIAYLLRVVRRRIDEGGTPVAVVLTHHHDDHVAGARTVATEVGIPVRAHATTLERLDLAGVDAASINDGEVFDLHGMTLRTIHTPGHAADHLAFHVPERDAVVAGDLLSGMSTILILPADGDMGAYLDSLRRVGSLECRVVLPGHGPPLPARAIEKTVQHRIGRETRILEALSDVGARELSEIAEFAYRDTPEAPAALKEIQTLAHLVHLERQGRARRIDENAHEWSP